MNNKTFAPNSNLVPRKWHFIDAKGKVLGRLSAEVAHLILGKNKPEFAPNAEVGDKVVLTNVGKIVVTGKKLKEKLYHRHTGFPKGYRVETYEEKFTKDPTKVIRLAVEGMLPKNRIRKDRMNNLFMYKGEEHPHKAQQK